MVEIAVHAGHFDQAHLTRDVRAPASTSPAILAPVLGPSDARIRLGYSCAASRWTG